MTENNTNIDNKEKNMEEILEQESPESTDAVAGMAYETEDELQETINKEQRNLDERRKIIDVKDLYVSFNTYAGEVKAVRGVSFDIHEGETLAIVGESGSGKTVVSKAILQILPKQSAVIKEGASIKYLDEEVLKMSKKRIKEYQGSDVAMIFQDPMTSLNPTMRIGKQIAESLKLHTKLSGDEIKKETIRLLKLVNIPNPEERVKQYPHELSGGMRQRVMIAIALACNPNVLIADEPTTALDAKVQAQIIDLFRDLGHIYNGAILFISHDLNLIDRICKKVMIMYAGRLVEKGLTSDVIGNPLHPYTKALLKAVPNYKKRGEALYNIKGHVPDLKNRSNEGCPFADRCDHTMDICTKSFPKSYEVNGHSVNCHLYGENNG